MSSFASPPRAGSLSPARTVLLALVCTLAALPAPARAAGKTLAECVEGGDFVANAARSRDNGMPRQEFLDRLDADFTAIRAFPPALRWFVQDGDDEALLRDAVRDVYDRPRPPERHAGAFLDACLSRARA